MVVEDQEEHLSLWKNILEAKYGVSMDGWEIKDASYRHSSMWRATFANNTDTETAQGRRFCFGQKLRLERDPYPWQSSFQIFSDVLRTVMPKYYMDRVHRQVLRGLMLRTNLLESKKCQLFSLLNLLGQVYIMESVDRGQGQALLMALSK